MILLAKESGNSWTFHDTVILVESNMHFPAWLHSKTKYRGAFSSCTQNFLPRVHGTWPRSDLPAVWMRSPDFNVALQDKLRCNQLL